MKVGSQFDNVSAPIGASHHIGQRLSRADQMSKGGEGTTNKEGFPTRNKGMGRKRDAKPGHSSALPSTKAKAKPSKAAKRREQTQEAQKRKRTHTHTHTHPKKK